jgi:hypothetical protein
MSNLKDESLRPPERRRFYEAVHDNCHAMLTAKTIGEKLAITKKQLILLSFSEYC